MDKTWVMEDVSLLTQKHLLIITTDKHGVPPTKRLFKVAMLDPSPEFNWVHWEFLEITVKIPIVLSSKKLKDVKKKLSVELLSPGVPQERRKAQLLLNGFTRGSCCSFLFIGVIPDAQVDVSFYHCFYCTTTPVLHFKKVGQENRLAEKGRVDQCFYKGRSLQRTFIVLGNPFSTWLVTRFTNVYGQTVSLSVQLIERNASIHQWKFVHGRTVGNELTLRFSDAFLKKQISGYPRYVVPTGRVKVPACRYVVPTGKVNVIVNVIVSAGRSKVIPVGRTILVLSEVNAQDELKGILNPYQKLKGFYKEFLNLGPKYIKDDKVERIGSHVERELPRMGT
ncbi:hypothetical protein Tco_1484540 [Tanacetum coccineum]